ncbi:anti-anti-sigma factor [Amycolatopsis bartoniae]|uniref:STAS domain-containing protein n=1 Tax=Amycolatopsis bartoniae TaxID=941986 RepID=A0A8H9ISQ2_9PSEU|nr:STAS domain-containing protein [Amycolatopsis bartoniae]MBB2938172.1 anti-anti-sigma factor [Amycolatopsis bartoniae]GHF33171.1 hypothetical protein GCM10017566_02250 [Amycolatopsis bartoniae]
MTFPCWWPPARPVESPSGEAVLLWQPHGELDAATGGVLQDYCERELLSRDTDVVVDLGGVTFLAASGITVLVRFGAALAARGRRLVTADGPPAVRRILGITRVTGVLSVRPTLEEALASLRPRVSSASDNTGG